MNRILHLAALALTMGASAILAAPAQPSPGPLPPAANRQLALDLLRDLVAIRSVNEAGTRAAAETADAARVAALSRRYGELDGTLSYLYAAAFARVGQSLSARQKQALTAMRQVDPSEPKGPFLYSTPIALPRIDGAEAFFGTRR